MRKLVLSLTSFLILGIFSSPLSADSHVFFLKGAPDDYVGVDLRLKLILETEPNPTGLFVIEGPAEGAAVQAEEVKKLLAVTRLSSRFQVRPGIVWDETTEADVRAGRFGLRLNNELINARNLAARSTSSFRLESPVLAILELQRLLSQDGKGEVHVYAYTEMITLIAALTGDQSLGALRSRVEYLKTQRAQGRTVPLPLSPNLLSRIKTMLWMAGGRQNPRTQKFEASRAWALLLSLLGDGQIAVDAINQLTAIPGSYVLSTHEMGGNLTWSDRLLPDFQDVARTLPAAAFNQLEPVAQWLMSDLPVGWIQAVEQSLPTRPDKPIAPSFASPLGAFMGVVQPFNGTASALGASFTPAQTNFVFDPTQTGVPEPLTVRSRILQIGSDDSVESLVRKYDYVGAAMTFLFDRASNGAPIRIAGIDPEAARSNRVWSSLFRHLPPNRLFNSLQNGNLDQFIPLIITTDAMLDDGVGIPIILLYHLLIKSRRPIIIYVESFETRLARQVLEETLAPFKSAGLNIQIVAGSGGDKLESAERRAFAEFAITGITNLAEAVLPASSIALFRRGGPVDSSDGLELLEEVLVDRGMPVDIVAMSDMRDLRKLAAKHGYSALSNVRNVLGNFWKNQGTETPLGYNGQLSSGLPPFLQAWESFVRLESLPTNFTHLPSSEFWTLNHPGSIEQGRLLPGAIRPVLERLAQSESFGPLGRMLLAGFRNDSNAFRDSRMRSELNFVPQGEGDFFVGDSALAILAIGKLYGATSYLNTARGMNFLRREIPLPGWQFTPKTISAAGENNIQLSEGGTGFLSEAQLAPGSATKIAPLILTALDALGNLGNDMDRTVSRRTPGLVFKSFRQQVAACARGVATARGSY